MERDIRLTLRHNFVVNVLDGGFFGLAMGFASFVTVLPLFVSQLTDSAILIGLVPAVHNVGWMLPQLLTANRVARLRRFLPMVLAMTTLERIPFFALAIIALMLAHLPRELALGLTFGLLVMQGLGGGFAATAWQSMVAKLIPAERRGTFYGTQAATSSLFASVSAVLAGLLLERFPFPLNFAICFGLNVLAMIVSFGFLAWTREPASAPPPAATSQGALAHNVTAILKRDRNFIWFLLSRLAFQVAAMAFGFYTVYAVKHLGASALSAGLLTGVYMGTQIIANPVMGWLGDHLSHRRVLEIGAVAATLGALLAWRAPSAEWFYLVFVLSGIANVAVWTITLAMTVDFARDPAERPTYIGLANTLVAPGAILAPILGGSLADSAGYPAMFFVAALGGAATWFILRGLLRDPQAG